MIVEIALGIVCAVLILVYLRALILLAVGFAFLTALIFFKFPFDDFLMYVTPLAALGVPAVCAYVTAKKDNKTDEDSYVRPPPLLSHTWVEPVGKERFKRGAKYFIIFFASTAGAIALATYEDWPSLALYALLLYFPYGMYTALLMMQRRFKRCYETREQQTPFGKTHSPTEAALQEAKMRFWM